MSTEPGPIRIMLVDDHAVLRSGLRLLLEREEGLEPVGEAGTAEDAAPQTILHASFSDPLRFSSRTARASPTARPAVGPPHAEPRPGYRARGAATPAAPPSAP